MRDTSLESYNSLRDVSGKQADVLIVIHGNPNCSDRDIAELLDRPINQITGRRNELEKAGWIKSSGYKLQNNRRVHTWVCVKQ